MNEQTVQVIVESASDSITIYPGVVNKVTMTPNADQKDQLLGSYRIAVEPLELQEYVTAETGQTGVIVDPDEKNVLTLTKPRSVQL
jgi:hypothetical protein